MYVKTTLTLILSCMLMSHFEEPTATEDEEPPTEQDKRKKMVSFWSVTQLSNSTDYVIHLCQTKFFAFGFGSSIVLGKFISWMRKGKCFDDKLCSHNAYASAFLLSLGKCCQNKHHLFTKSGHCYTKTL